MSNFLDIRAISKTKNPPEITSHKKYQSKKIKKFFSKIYKSLKTTLAKIDNRFPVLDFLQARRSRKRNMQKNKSK